MKNKIFSIVCTLLMTITTSAATTLPIKGTIISPTNPNICYVGRISFKNPERPMFNWPGIQIIARFEGTSLRMIAKPKSGYFVCTIDNAEPFKVSFNAPRDSVVTLATALQNGIHEVRLMYAIEGRDRHAEFRGFVLDEHCSLAQPPALPERRIEFIGNSITCSFGIESLDQADKYCDETENHYLSYASQVSRNLNALHTAIARSGIGVYRNYNGPKSGNKITMQNEFNNTIYGSNLEKWDFAQWIPQVVCINLGTNDFSTNNYNAGLYERAYRNFLQSVRNAYPNAKIVLLNGPMMAEKTHNIQGSILDKLTREFNEKGDKDIYRFAFTPQTGDLGYGACWHPSLLQHGRMAEELTPFLQKIMNW